MGAPPTSRDLERRISKVRWWHSIDLGGITTPGHKTPEQHRREYIHFPDVRGKTVLDIGAWDGFYSFYCERMGAKSVTSLDHFIWHMDVPGWLEYVADCEAKGTETLTPERAGLYFPEGLPGRAGYELAHEILGSRAEPVVADYMDFTGSFDVVLYLGVLYHMQSPYLSLLKVAELTREVAVIETEAAEFPGMEHIPLFEFFPRSELRLGDPTNYFAPNMKGLTEICLAAGFKRVEVKLGPAPDPPAPFAHKVRVAAGGALRVFGLKKPLPPVRTQRYRAIVLAWK